MPETLILRLGSTNELVDWVVVDAAGRISPTARGTLAEAAGAAAERRLMTLAPAEQVLRIKANIPLKGNAKIRQALPFALEEQIAGDIEAQHFAFTKADKDGSIPVAVVADSLMSGWLEELADAGLKPDSLRPESDGLPDTPATVSILIEDTSVTIRDYNGEFIVTDSASIALVLDMLMEQHSEAMENDTSLVPVNVIVYCNLQVQEQLNELWDRLRLKAESVDLKTLDDGALPFLANQLMASDGINLLQGSYQPKTDLNIEWGPWRLPGALLAACVLLALCIQGASYWQLTRAEAALDQAAAQVLLETFPDAGETSDPWDALQARLNVSSGSTVSASGPGFDETLGILAEAFAATPDLNMQTMAYRNGILDLQLLAPDVSSLDKLRQQISESDKFTASIQSANPDKDVIKGRMQITVVSE